MACNDEFSNDELSTFTTHPSNFTCFLDSQNPHAAQSALQSSSPSSLTLGYSMDVLKKPRRVEEPSDFRPNSKKGKIDDHPIWIVHIKMPKQLIFDVFKGTVRDSEDTKVDLESIYQYNDTDSNKPTAQAADAAVGETTAQEPVANAPAQ